MQIPQLDYVGRRMPARLTGRWLTPLQLIWAIPMFAVFIFVFNTQPSYLLRGLTLVVWLAGWTMFRYAPGYMLPWQYIKRLRIRRRGYADYDNRFEKVLRDIIGSESDPGKPRHPDFKGVRHTTLSYESNGANGEPLSEFRGVFTSGPHATLYLDLNGVRSVGTDPDILISDHTQFSEGLKDVANRQGEKPIQIGTHYLVGPNDPHKFITLMGTDAMHPQDAALPADPVLITRLYNNVLEGEKVASGPGITRTISVNAVYPGHWSKQFGKPPASSDTSGRLKPLRKEHVMGSSPFRDIDALQGDWESLGGVTPHLQDLLDQIVFVRRALDPVSALSTYRTLHADREAIAAGNVHNLSDLRLVDIGAFPSRPYAGHNWLRIGQSLHRILIVSRYRRRDRSLDYYARVLEALQVPCLVSAVGITTPGRYHSWVLEQQYMLTQDLQDVFSGGDYGGTKASQERVKEASAKRDEILGSGAPSIDMSIGIVVSGATIEEVNLVHDQVDLLFSRERITLEPVTGEENQWPVMLHLLNLVRIP